MKLGIKVGLKGDSYSDLLAAKPDFCEMWFHSGKISEYDELFSQIKSLKVECGLHFWGALEDKTLANVCYPDTNVLTTSIELIKKTIDTAQKQNCWYVNIHPGGAKLSRVDFEAQEFTSYTQAVSYEKCQEVFAQSLGQLAPYAASKGVLLLIESVPLLSIGHPWYGQNGAGRLRPVDLAELPLKYMESLLDQPNVYFTNDFGHTACNLITDDRTAINTYLTDVTTRLAPQTKLIHTGYIKPPYNGTDYHGCLYYDEFTTTAAIPNYTEMQNLLALFKNRSDVGALMEPETDHPRNYEYLKKLVSEIS